MGSRGFRLDLAQNYKEFMESWCVVDGIEVKRRRSRVAGSSGSESSLKYRSSRQIPVHRGGDQADVGGAARGRGLPARRCPGTGPSLRPAWVSSCVWKTFGGRIDVVHKPVMSETEGHGEDGGSAYCSGSAS